MSNFENVLCVIDPTVTSQPALQRAEWFARQSGAKLGLLICYYNEFLSGHTVFDSRSLKKARDETIELHSKRLKELAEPGRALGLEVDTAVIWDHPLCDGIVRHACSTGADIVFKDTHQHSGIGLTSLSNTDWSLIRTCPVPLWLVKPHDFPKRPPVVAAIDPTHMHDKSAALDNEILEISEYVAALANGDVHAFHSVEKVMVMAPLATDLITASTWMPSELDGQIRLHHQRRFDEIVNDCGIAKDRAHLVTGYAHEALPELAEQLDAGLVVMGAVARNRLKRIFIGATAERTLERLPCDLLVVKPDWFETPVDKEIEHAA